MKRMKKLSKVLVGAALASTLFAGSAFAGEDVRSKQDDVQKDANSSFEYSSDSVLTGEAVDFKVTTEKKGSSYSITWTGATEGTTTLLDGVYTSDATFTSDEAGNFEVGYTLVMRAGKSHVTWVDGDKVTIEVTDPETEGTTPKPGNNRNGDKHEDNPNQGSGGDREKPGNGKK